MYVLQHHSRRLLQATAAASSPSNGDPSNNNFDINAHFSPSMAIILVVLLSAFFFMGFFSIYVRRCTTRADDEAARARTARDPTHPPANAQSQGVDPAFLETLPLVSYSSSKKKGSNVECVVCLTDFEEGEPLCQLPRCKHVFHKECIDMWLYSHTTCPLCRRSVQSEGSLSFRWGGSGSLRLSLGRIRSRRDQSGRGSTAEPSTPGEGQGSVSHRGANANPNADANAVERIVLPSARSLPRSHSTGHSLVKHGHSRMLMRVGTPDYSDTEQETEAKTGCLPVTPTAVFRRSRSMIAVRDETATPPVSIGAWMRGARASLRRALSFKKVNPAAGDFGTPGGLAAAAASSSARSTFDRLNPVV